APWKAPPCPVPSVTQNKGQSFCLNNIFHCFRFNSFSGRVANGQRTAGPVPGGFTLQTVVSKIIFAVPPINSLYIIVFYRRDPIPANPIQANPSCTDLLYPH
ncbi:MAG: hypothetical protein ACYC0Q_15355, partial [Eubacteriales bacterium]